MTINNKQYIYLYIFACAHYDGDLHKKSRGIIKIIYISC